MILVTGGAFQGKKKYAVSLLDRENLQKEMRETQIADGATCSEEDCFRAEILDHFHLYIRRLLEAGKDPKEFLDALLLRNPDVILISTELGYGVVPVDPDDRKWRESCGRVCTAAAASAHRVYRVVCGIGCRLK